MVIPDLPDVRWAHLRSTLFAPRSLCCIDQPEVQEDVAERTMNDRSDRRDRPGNLGLALADNALNDRQRLLLDPLQMVAPLEALRVELVDIFGARGPRREPGCTSGSRGR